MKNRERTIEEMREQIKEIGRMLDEIEENAKRYEEEEK